MSSWQLCPGSVPLSLIRASAKARSSNRLFPDFVSIIHLPGAVCFSLPHRADVSSTCGAAEALLPLQTPNRHQVVGKRKDLSRGELWSAVWEQHAIRVGRQREAPGAATSAPSRPLCLHPRSSPEMHLSLHEFNVCHRLLDNPPYQPKFPIRLLTTRCVSAALHPRCSTACPRLHSHLLQNN